MSNPFPTMTSNVASGAANSGQAERPSALEMRYQPATPDEEYMCASQRDYFRRKLQLWREELLLEAQATIDDMRSDAHFEVGDECDRASRESSQALELRTRDRHRKLLRKINQALLRIDSGDYGYCEVSGEPIGIARLDIRPVATLSVEEQEAREIEERHRRG